MSYNCMRIYFVAWTLFTSSVTERADPRRRDPRHRKEQIGVPLEPSLMDICGWSSFNVELTERYLH